MISLRQVREARGLTQLDVAALAGTTQGFISLAEARHRRIGPETRRRIARGLGLNDRQAARIKELAS